MLGFGQKKIAIALTCADWRLHRRGVDLNGRIGRALKVNGVDLIAVPGPDGLLIPAREWEWKSAVRQVALLVKAHAPVALVVVAHQKCAGHPVSDQEHDIDVAKTAEALKKAVEFGGPVSAMVATYKSDTNWGLKTVATF